MKYKFIVIRGCIVRVRASNAAIWEKIEKKLQKKDWGKNRVD